MVSLRRVKSLSSATSKVNKKLWHWKSSKRGKAKDKTGQDETTFGSVSTTFEETKTEKLEKQNSKLPPISAQHVVSTEQEEFVRLIKRLSAQAKATDQKGDLELAIQQYSAIRNLIKTGAPVFDGGVAAVDAKIAHAMGLIYEYELRDYREAQSLYSHAFEFYKSTLDCLHEAQLQQGSSAQHPSYQQHMKVQDELTERVCTLLLRMSVTSGNQNLWAQAHHQAKKALRAFETLSGEDKAVQDMDKMEEEIRGQIHLCKVMQEEEERRSARKESTTSQPFLCLGPQHSNSVETSSNYAEHQNNFFCAGPEIQSTLAAAQNAYFSMIERLLEGTELLSLSTMSDEKRRKRSGKERNARS